MNNNSFPKLAKYSVQVEVVGNNCKRPFSEYIRLLYNDSDNQILMRFIGTCDFSNWTSLFKKTLPSFVWKSICIKKSCKQINRKKERNGRSVNGSFPVSSREEQKEKFRRYTSKKKLLLTECHRHRSRQCDQRLWLDSRIKRSAAECYALHWTWWLIVPNTLVLR